MRVGSLLLGVGSQIGNLSYDHFYLICSTNSNVHNKVMKINFKWILSNSLID